MFNKEEESLFKYMDNNVLARLAKEKFTRWSKRFSVVALLEKGTKPFKIGGDKSQSISDGHPNSSVLEFSS